MSRKSDKFWAVLPIVLGFLVGTTMCVTGATIGF